LGEGVCDARYGRLVSLGLLRREINELDAEEIRFVRVWWMVVQGALRVLQKYWIIGDVTRITKF
jgi:hypothetical protein